MNPTPEDAAKQYINGRTDTTPSTLDNIRYRLMNFAGWCDENGIRDLDTLTTAHLHQYKVDRSQEVKNVTLKYHLGSVAQFLDWAEGMNFCSEGLGEFTREQLKPAMQRNEDVADYSISEKRVNRILDYLEKFEYATMTHVIFYVLWHTGMRTSSLRALDVSDYNGRVLKVRHRPETGTGLKNKEAGERNVNVKPKVAEVIDNWVETNHPRTEDEHGRMPLLATTNGRAHRTTIQSKVYKITRPCVYAECTENRNPEDCEAALNAHASKCPGNINPHAIRKGSITYHLNQQVPKEVASDRMDVSTGILDKHYDQADNSEKAQRRSDHLGGI
jgi:integrase